MHLYFSFVFTTQKPVTSIEKASTAGMSIGRKTRPGMTLVELLIVLSVLAVITAVAMPSISRLLEGGNKAKAMANAKQLESISASLASLGVAHVIPDSMGGVEATARLIREGVIVPEGPMAGEQFIMAGLSDDEISELSKYLRVQYDLRELRLVAKDPDS